MRTYLRQLLCALFVAILPGLVFAQTPDSIKEDAWRALNSGLKAYRASDTQGAIDHFKRAVELEPNFTIAQLYLGTAYASLLGPGQNNSAEIIANGVQAFQRVLEKEPNNVEAEMGLGDLYSRSGDLLKAREAYVRAARFATHEGTAFYSVASIDWILVTNRNNALSPSDKARLNAEGLQYIEVALALSPGNSDSLAYKNLLLRQKAQLVSDPAEAVQLTAEADVIFSQALDARRQESRAGASPPPTGLQAAPPPPPPAATATAGQRVSTDTLVRVGGDVAQTNLVNKITPDYPAAARAARIQGAVLLQAIIDKAGTVQEVRVMSGHPMLTEAALDAVRQWRYKPILLNGQPVDVITTITVNFTFQ